MELFWYKIFLSLLEAILSALVFGPECPALLAQPYTASKKVTLSCLASREVHEFQSLEN